MAKYLNTTIEITDSHVKFFQSKDVRGRNLVTAFDLRPLQKHTDEEVSSAIKDLTFSRNIELEHLNVVVSRRLAILKLLKLPSQNEAEIKKMIGLQLVNQIPYALEEIVFEYQVLDKDSAGYTHILIIALHKDVSHRYLEIFNKINLPPSKLVLSSFGLLGWVIHQEQKKKIDTKQPSLVINIDYAHSEFCFIYNRKLIFSRNVNQGLKDIQSDQGIELFNQIRLSVGAYQKDSMGPELKKIILISSAADTVFLKERIEKDLKHPTDIFHPGEHFFANKNVDLSHSRDGVSTAVGLGFLFSDTKKALNLLPHEVHETKRSRIRKKLWIKLIFMIAVILGLLGGLFGKDLYEKIMVLKDLEAKVKKTKSEAALANDQIAFFQKFHNEFKKRSFIPEVMAELNRLAPKEVSFYSLYIDEKGNFIIQGYAETSGSVNAFQERLVASSVFKRVNLQFATKRKIFNLEVTDFKITCQLVDAKEAP